MLKRKKTGSLIVISGPSGSGKGTIIKELLKKNHDLSLSVSAKAILNLLHIIEDMDKQIHKMKRHKKKLPRYSGKKLK